MEIVLAAINAKWIHPSLALRLLKANLGELENECEILEFALRQPLCEKTAPILAARPKLLGFSVSIWNHLATIELLKELDKLWESGQRPVIVLGGPEVSWLAPAPGNREPEPFRLADYVIRGEGEESFRSLCYDVFRGKRRAVQTNGGTAAPAKAAPVIINGGDKTADVKKINSPYRLYTDEDLRKKLVYVEASRGCPFSCEFCQSSIRSSGQPGSVREFPLEPFLAEIGKLIDRGARTFKFLDRSFNLNIDRAKKIMEFFLHRIEADEKGGAGSGMEPGASEEAVSGACSESRVALRSSGACSESRTGAEKRKRLCVHFEMVPFLFPAELKELIRRFPPETLRLEVGIQTFNKRTAELIYRAGQADGRELENLEFLRRETNVILHVDLIAGLPGEDLISFGKGFDRLWQAMTAGAESSHSHENRCYPESSHSHENHYSPGSSHSRESHYHPESSPRFEIQLGILKCLPGTPIVRHSEAYGMRYSTAPPYEVIETGLIPEAELKRIKNFARFWEIIVNRNPFPEIVSGLLRPGEPAFEKFMRLSDSLYEHFGRNWGIDREELRSQLLRF